MHSPSSNISMIPAGLWKISIFCRRFPLLLSGAWTIIRSIRSFRSSAVSPCGSVYFRTFFSPGCGTAPLTRLKVIVCSVVSSVCHAISGLQYLKTLGVAFSRQYTAKNSEADSCGQVVHKTAIYCLNCFTHRKNTCYRITQQETTQTIFCPLLCPKFTASNAGVRTTAAHTLSGNTLIPFMAISKNI